MSSRTGKVQTVRGLAEPESLGTTMMHEHVFFDGASYYREPDDESLKARSLEPVSLENLWWMRYNPFHSKDGLLFDDYDGAVLEVRRLAEVGGGTLVDATPRLAEIARPVEDLARVSADTGINIVKGCGFYVDGSYRAGDCVPTASVDDLTALIVHDLEIGEDTSGIKAGIIGEIGCTWPLKENEIKVLHASAQAQTQSGVSITIHPGRNEAAPTQIRDILAGAGADLRRVVIGHIDRCGYELATRRDLLDSGCVLEYDFFGWEGHYPSATAIREGKLPDIPNDVARIRELKQLIELGYARQLVLSHDVSNKMQRTLYGGYGFGHILRNVLPLMAIYGIKTDAIDAMLRETPRRLLTIA